MKETLKEYREGSSAMPAMRSTGWAVAALCLLGAAASGCRGGDRGEVAPTVSAQQTPAVAAAQAPTIAAKQIPTINAEQVRTLVNDRKGKVVVVNFWASWCPPCVREFPAIIKVYEQHRDKGMDMFAVSMNSPEEMADIEEFLQKQNPPFPIYLADSKDEKFSAEVLKDWYGEMPLTLVFNTAGENVLAHRNEITYEELSSTVESLLPPQ